MTENKIKKVISAFSESVKSIYGDKLSEIILYGSCARGDYSQDSDIDILVLLNVAPGEINDERSKLFDISDELDLQYDVVLAPVLQSIETYEKYMPVSSFYQNVHREGVKIAWIYTA